MVETSNFFKLYLWVQRYNFVPIRMSFCRCKSVNLWMQRLRVRGAWYVGACVLGSLLEQVSRGWFGLGAARRRLERLKLVQNQWWKCYFSIYRFICTRIAIRPHLCGRIVQIYVMNAVDMQIDHWRSGI